MTAPSSPTTRRALFPDATTDAPLQVRRPRRTIVRARPLALTIYWIAGTVGAMALIGSLGPDDVMLTNALPPAVEDVFWTLVAWTLGGCASAYVVLRLLHRGLRWDARVPWDQYATERGLRPVRKLRLDSRVDVLKRGHTRRFEAIYAGRLASCGVQLGATEWHEDHGDDETTHHAFFVVAALDPDVAKRWPATSVTRYFHGSLDFEQDLPDGEELRLESWSVDIDCNIRVDGAPPDDVRWRELFDPILLEALADHVEIQWRQEGRFLVACAGGFDQDSAPVQTMDTLCLGVETALAAFGRAAVGDVEARDADVLRRAA